MVQHFYILFSKYPGIGVMSAVVSAVMSNNDLLQMIALSLGVFIAIITSIIKIIELKHLYKKNKSPNEEPLFTNEEIREMLKNHDLLG